MWQRLTEYPLTDLQSISSWVPYAILLIGLFLWLVGAKFGRSILTLALVFCGAMLGKYVPQAMGWSIHPMGSIIAGALVVGILGFLLYRLVLAVGLGAILALWVVTIILVLARITLTIPEDGTVADLIGQMDSLIKSLPQTKLYVGSATGLALGLIIGLLTPRFGMALFFSLLGVRLGLVGGWFLALREPSLLEKIPSGQTAQAGIIVGLVLLGTLIQYWLIRKSGVPAGASAADNDADEQDDEG